MTQQRNHTKPQDARGPTSGRGASSALEAMVRRRITPPKEAPAPGHGKDGGPQAASRQRRH